MRALDLVAEWPAADPAVAVLGRDGVVLDSVGALDRRDRWASITKLLTALAVLVAWEEGTLDLDDPAGPPGSTVRHLLAHTSGLPFEGDTPIATPGQRRIYSNTGYERLAAALEHRAGMPFGTYLAGAVLEPLALRPATLEGTAAAGMVADLDDLVRLARELQAPTIVAGETLALATTVAFPGLRGVLPGLGSFDPLDWGLGFELRDGKSPHWTGERNSPATFGHFGGSGSFLWVDPVAGLAVCGLSGGTEFGPWALEAWPTLADAVLEQWRS